MGQISYITPAVWGLEGDASAVAHCPNLARESSDDDTLILLGHTFQTPQKMCMVFNTLR